MECLESFNQCASHSEASSGRGQPAAPSSAGTGRRSAAAARKRREAAVCTSEAGHPAELTPAQSEPKQVQNPHRTWAH